MTLWVNHSIRKSFMPISKHSCAGESLKTPKSWMESQQCKTIAFFSLRGGTGVSTLATNISVALSQMWQAPAVLIDLVLTCGQSAMMLNQTLRTTWADLARIPVDEYTAELIDEVLMKHDTDVRILAAPPSSELAELVTGESVERVLEILSSHYEYIIHGPSP